MGRPAPEGGLRSYLSPDEVRQRGIELQRLAPPDVHDHSTTSTHRPDVADFIRASNADRLPHLIPLRVGRMVSSPFAFFRGAAGLMAADLAGTPTSGLKAQLCGDAHAANFGLYGTSNGAIVMDMNDFDETLAGPWEWDLKRLAASLVLAGRDSGVPARGCLEAAEDAVKSYRRTTRRLAELPFMRSWTALPDESSVTVAKADELIDDFADAARKARLNTSARLAERLTHRLDDHSIGWRSHRFVEDAPVLTRIGDDEAESVVDGLERYVDTLRESRRHLITRFAVSDVAFRVVGTGSVGLRSYVALLHGNGNEHLVLHVKQAMRSALADPLGVASERHEGERIVQGARLVQADTDILLGWTTIDERPYIVRQFRNMKGAIDPTRLRRDHLDDYGRLAGALLARAHSRSLDPRLLAGYFSDDDRIDEVIGEYAVRYADQTETDHARLRDAVADGEFESVTA